MVIIRYTEGKHKRNLCQLTKELSWDETGRKKAAHPPKKRVRHALRYVKISRRRKAREIFAAGEAFKAPSFLHFYSDF